MENSPQKRGGMRSLGSLRRRAVDHTHLVETTPRELAETLARRTHVYRPARYAYHRLLRPRRLEQRGRRQRFFSQFVSPGQLVFDVGANEGVFTEVFLELGARVVAVEPLPHLADRIARRYRSAALAVEEVALGAEEGEAELHVGRLSVHSTISPEWIVTVKSTGGDRWVDRVTTPVSTLDVLISRYGRPDFLKLDVEGYEAEVLKGLSEPVPVVSFEVQKRTPAKARTCIDSLLRLADYEFNVVPGVEWRLLHEHWIRDPSTIVTEVAQLSPRAGTGDVYARIPSPQF